MSQDDSVIGKLTRRVEKRQLKQKKLAKKKRKKSGKERIERENLYDQLEKTDPTLYDFSCENPHCKCNHDNEAWCSDQNPAPATHVITSMERTGFIDSSSVDNLIESITSPKSYDVNPDNVNMQTFCSNCASKIINNLKTMDRNSGFPTQTTSDGTIHTKKLKVNVSPLEPVAATKAISTASPDILVDGKVKPLTPDTTRYKLLEHLSRLNLKRTFLPGGQIWAGGVLSPNKDKHIEIIPAKIVPVKEGNPRHPTNNPIFRSQVKPDDIDEDDDPKAEEDRNLGMGEEFETERKIGSELVGIVERGKYEVHRKIDPAKYPDVQKYRAVVHSHTDDCIQKGCDLEEGDYNFIPDNKNGNYIKTDSKYPEQSWSDYASNRDDVHREKLLENLAKDHKNCCENGSAAVMHEQRISAENKKIESPLSDKFGIDEAYVPVFLPGGHCGYDRGCTHRHTCLDPQCINKGHNHKGNILHWIKHPDYKEHSPHYYSVMSMSIPKQKTATLTTPTDEPIESKDGVYTITDVSKKPTYTDEELDDLFVEIPSPKNSESSTTSHKFLEQEPTNFEWSPGKGGIPTYESIKDYAYHWQQMADPKYAKAFAKQYGIESSEGLANPIRFKNSDLTLRIGNRNFIHPGAWGAKDNADDRRLAPLNARGEKRKQRDLPLLTCETCLNEKVSPRRAQIHSSLVDEHAAWHDNGKPFHKIFTQQSQRKRAKPVIPGKGRKTPKQPEVVTTFVPKKTKGIEPEVTVIRKEDSGPQLIKPENYDSTRRIPSMDMISQLQVKSNLEKSGVQVSFTKQENEWVEAAKHNHNIICGSGCSEQNHDLLHPYEKAVLGLLRPEAEGTSKVEQQPSVPAPKVENQIDDLWKNS